MANVIVLNALGSAVYLKSAGAGTDVDPHIPTHTIDAALPAGTNNMGDVDVLTVVGDNADLDSGPGTDDHAVVAVGIPDSGGHRVWGGGVVASIAGNPAVTASVAGAPTVLASIPNVPGVSVMSCYVSPQVIATVAGTPTVLASIAGAPTVLASIPNVPSVSIASNYVPTVTASVIGNPTVLASIAGAPAVMASIPNVPKVSIASWFVGGQVVASVIGNPAVTASVAGIPQVTLASTYINQAVVASIAGNPAVLASIAGAPTVVASTIGTIFAVVNTGAVGTQNAVIGGAVVASTIGTIFAVVNTGAVGTQNAVVNTQATVNIADGLVVASIIGNPVVLASIAGAPSVLASIPNVSSVAVASFLPHIRPYTVGSQISAIARVQASTANAAALAAKGAGVYNYITQLSVINGAASYGGAVNVCDGTATLFCGYAAPAGGGFAVNFPAGLKPAANATVFCAVPVYSLDLYITISGFQGP